MKKVTFRFYEELNDFLAKEHRKVTFTYQFNNNPRVIEVIEQLGVPHSGIDLILINGKSVGFDERLQDQDHIAVYPVFEAIDITAINKLRPKPLRQNKFILDVHLGRLAKYLRMCGFDCYYENLDDNEIIELALEQRRIILTKDKNLLKDKRVTHGYWVRATLPKKQLLEIIKRFDLANKIKFLTRCLLCNRKLKKVAQPEKLKSLIPPEALKFYKDFYLCEHCNKIYWEGSHYENMMELVRSVILQIP